MESSKLSILTPFQCELCKKCFDVKETMREHFLTCTDGYVYGNNNVSKQKYSRTECAFSTESEGISKRHAVQHGKGLHRCDDCPRAFSSRVGLKVHQRLHNKKCYTCPTCGTGFKTKCTLQEHEKSHLIKEEEDSNDYDSVFRCDQCSYSTAIERHLNQHLSTHLGERLHVCDICGKDFGFRSSLINHKKTHKVKEEPLEEDVDGNFMEHMTVHSVERPHRCHVCDKTFARKGGLATHLRVHSRKRSHVCGTCGKGFYRKSILKEHEETHLVEEENTVHPDPSSVDQRFNCTECAYSTDHEGSYKQHQLTHSGEQPHRCEVCDATFAEKRNLIRHFLVHTGDRPFECDTSDKSFAQKSDMITHQKTHWSKDRDEQRPGCPKCPYSMFLKNYLSEHLLRDPLCEDCGQTFAEMAELRSHLVTHSSGESPDAILPDYPELF